MKLIGRQDGSALNGFVVFQNQIGLVFFFRNKILRVAWEVRNPVLKVLRTLFND